MAITVNGLNRELRDLETRLANEERLHQEKLREIERKYADSIRRCQQEKNAALEALRRDLSAQNRQLVDQATRNLQAQCDAQLAELRNHNRLFQDRCDTIILQMQRENEKNTALLNEYKKNAEKSEKGQKRLAEEFISDATDCETELMELPIRQFFGDEFPPIRALLENARNMKQKGIYQSAMAMASTAISNMTSLRARFSKKYREWEEFYFQWNALVQNAYNNLTDARNETVKTCMCESTLDDYDWNFWTEGEYKTLSTDLHADKTCADNIRSTGILQYLKRNDALSIEDLKEKCLKADKYDGTIEHLKDKCRSEVKLSDDREFIAEKIVETMKAVHYKLSEDTYGYIPPDLLIANNSWYKEYHDAKNDTPDIPITDYIDETANSLQCFSFEMVNRGEDTLVVHIVPDRIDNVARRNVCIIDFKLKGAQNKDIYQDLLSKAYERIDKIYMGLYPFYQNELKIDFPTYNVIEPKPKEIDENRIKQKTDEYQKGKVSLRKPTFI